MPRFSVMLVCLVVFVACAAVGGWYMVRSPERSQPANPPAPPAEPEAPTKPSLVVLVVFDQMRGDYLSRWAGQFGPDGFERIKKEGVWFSECHIPYACTSTGPGHASLATGAPPAVHGIVENVWYDRTCKPPARVYCAQPKRPYELVPPVPAALGKPDRGSAIGFSPHQLLSETVGDSLQAATNGKGRVFSLSIKDRTAVLMGGQKPTGVYCFDTRDGRFHTGAYYREQVHPFVSEFNAAKLADSWFEEEWRKLRGDIDYKTFSGPDDALGEAHGPSGRVEFPHALKGELAAPAKPYYAAVEASPFGNELLVALAKKAVTAERLGKGEAADLLLVSFSSNDIIGHIWGPDSQEMMDVTLRSDRLVGEFLKFLDANVGKGRYVLVVGSDHGVCPLPEQKKLPAAQRVPLAEVAGGLHEALNARFGADPGGRADWFEVLDEGVWPWVYLNPRAAEDRNLKFDDVCAAARDWLAGREYIDAAYTRKDLEDGKFPADRPFKKMAALAYRADRCGDVVVIPKPGVLVTPYRNGTSHSSPQPYDAHVPLLVYGAGVPALGKRAEKVSSLSVAPTLARALGVPAPKDAKEPVPEALRK